MRTRLERIHPANLLAGAAVLASGALLLHWLFRLTFWRDEWEFLLHRRSWSPSSFFDPWVEELLAIPVAIYKVLVTTFGMDSAHPFEVVAVLLFLTSVVMLFVYMRPRVGEWLALAGILPILFLGQAWDDLLFPFQMALFGSISCGIGALLALERRDRAGDIAATVLLIGSLFFFDLGIAFVAGATLEVALRSDRFRRAWVVAVPTGLWLLWYAGWGHNAHTFISFHNAANAPSYVLDGLSSTVATLLGLGVHPRRLPDLAARLGSPAAGRRHRAGRLAALRPATPFRSDPGDARDPARVLVADGAEHQPVRARHGRPLPVHQRDPAAALRGRARPRHAARAVARRRSPRSRRLVRP